MSTDNKSTEMPLVSFRGIPRPLNRVVAFGNPLLDTTVYVRDNYLYEKHNLQTDGQKEVGAEEMQSLWDDVKSCWKYQTPGGCAQNTLRILQWLMLYRCEATIFGSVGDDKTAEDMKKLLIGEGVTPRYIVQKNMPTGKVLAFVKDSERSLVAYLGAAEHLPLNSLLELPYFQSTMKTADFIYIEGFFLTNRETTALHVLAVCAELKKLVIFNISGEYLLNVIPETVKHFVEHSDVIFGNSKEFEAVQRYMNLNSFEALYEHLSKSRGDASGKREIILVITEGAGGGRCFYDGGKVHKFKGPILTSEYIQDTTGAGDAFTAGFISGLCQCKNVIECCGIGLYATHQIMQEVGCTLPTFVPMVYF